MKNHDFSKTIMLFTALAVLFLSLSCNTPATDDAGANAMADTTATVAATAPVNPDYEIASPEYSDLAKKATAHLSNFEYDAWGTMLADNAEYYFPDGDENTRTKLVGKQAILDWWKNWQKTTGVQSMTFSLANYIPINSIKTPEMTGLTGIYVFAFFTNKVVYKGAEASIRMNMSLHFNENKLIDRYYTYYDRTPIIEAMGVNILETKASKK